MPSSFWPYFGFIVFGVGAVIVKAVLVVREGRRFRSRAPMTEEEKRKWDDAVRGP